MKTWIATLCTTFALAALTAAAQDGDRIGPDLERKILIWIQEHRPEWAQELQTWKERGEEERVQEALRRFEREMLAEAHGWKVESSGAVRFERLLQWLAPREPARARALKTLIDEKRFDVAEREFEDALQAMDRETSRAATEPKDPEVRERETQNARLEAASRELADAYRKAGGEEKEAIRGKLRETLAQLFEVREWFRHRELERLQREIDQMRRVLEERQANRERILEKRLSELIGEGDPLDW